MEIVNVLNHLYEVNPCGQGMGHVYNEKVFHVHTPSILLVHSGR